jgi:hypothetical protein
MILGSPGFLNASYTATKIRQCFLIDESKLTRRDALIKKRTTKPLLAVLLTLSPLAATAQDHLQPIKCTSCADWNQEQTAFNIVNNT